MSKKQKYRVATLILAVTIMGLSYNIFITRSLPALKLFGPSKTVAIDPGHGSIDKGAVHEETGVAESPINLAVAVQLKQMLKRQKYNVILTRDKETTEKVSNCKELQRRIDLASKSEADILVSIHANKYPDPQYYGAQCFYNPQKQESKQLALLIQEELKNMDPENIREAIPQDLYILRESPMPAVLVEMGFLSNPKDRERLQDPTYQKKMAQCIEKGIKRYYAGDSPVRTPEYN
ncbi:MAG TPA: N-acetylmuramoyl-L-alanine amidase [Thermoanaerobacterales bacterium]|nr:N-acetylmuramoyl-L-alanine amidase [Thermoanaerobacterales bacterium]